MLLSGPGGLAEVTSGVYQGARLHLLEPIESQFDSTQWTKGPCKPAFLRPYGNYSHQAGDLDEH